VGVWGVCGRASEGPMVSVLGPPDAPSRESSFVLWFWFCFCGFFFSWSSSASGSATIRRPRFRQNGVKGSLEPVDCDVGPFVSVPCERPVCPLCTLWGVARRCGCALRATSSPPVPAGGAASSGLLGGGSGCSSLGVPAARSLTGPARVLVPYWGRGLGRRCLTAQREVVGFLKVE